MSKWLEDWIEVNKLKIKQVNNKGINAIKNGKEIKKIYISCGLCSYTCKSCVKNYKLTNN